MTRVNFKASAKELPIVTYLFLFLNILIFLYEMYLNHFNNIEYKVFISNFSLSLSSINDHFLISLFSNGFLHANFTHILFNMFFLLTVGSKIEYEIGNFYFLGLYLFSLFFASVFSFFYIIFWNSFVEVLGASGALFGLFAFYALYFDGAKGLKAFIVFFIAYHLLFIYLLKINLAFYAHLGGSLAGMFYYWVFFKKEED